MKQNKPLQRKDKLVTETQLDQKIENYTQVIVQDISENFYSKFKENKQEHEKLNKILDKILVSQDILLEKFETWEQENAVGAHQIHEIRSKVDSHESRITKLEAKN